MNGGLVTLECTRKNTLFMAQISAITSRKFKTNLKSASSSLQVGTRIKLATDHKKHHISLYFEKCVNIEEC